MTSLFRTQKQELWIPDLISLEGVSQCKPIDLSFLHTLKPLCSSQTHFHELLASHPKALGQLNWALLLVCTARHSSLWWCLLALCLGRQFGYPETVYVRWMFWWYWGGNNSRLLNGLVCPGLTWRCVMAQTILGNGYIWQYSGLDGKIFKARKWKQIKM